MSEDLEVLDDWKPMSDDFRSIEFNSYCNGQTAAHMPYHLLPSFGRKTSEPKRHQNVKLFIEGFPSDLTETGLKNFLSRIGCKVLAVKIVISKTRLGRHISFADFETTKAAQKAIEIIRSQSIYKLSVSFAASVADKQEKYRLIERERKEFESQMKPKIDLGNCSAINANNSNGRPAMSPVNSESSHDSSCMEVLTPLAKADKLLKVLQRPDDMCSFCSEDQKLEHLHFILSDNQIVDPNQIPGLVDLDTTCLMCGKKSSEPKLCAQCRSVVYCSQSCQSGHWPKHRNTCKVNDDSIQFNSLAFNKSLKGFNDSNSISRTAETPKMTETIASKGSPKVDNTRTKTSTPVVTNVRQLAKESTPVVDPKVGGDIEGLPKPVFNKDPAVRPKEASPKKSDSVPIKELSPKKVEQKVSLAPQKKISVEKDPESNEKSEDTTDSSSAVQSSSVQTIACEVLIDDEDGLSICFGRTPFDFYLHKAKAFDNMEAFYNEITEKKDEFPQLTDQELRKGALCGGIYSVDDLCYRARIVDKIDDNNYALYFIDYGNTEPVAKKDIKRLPSLFFSCKAQAIHCTVESKVPIGTQWSKEAIALFADISEMGEYTRAKVFNKLNETYKIDLLNKKGESITKPLLEKNKDSVKDPVTTPQKTPITTPPKAPNSSPPKATVEDSPKVTFNKSSVNDVKDPKVVPKMAPLVENTVSAVKPLPLNSYFESVKTESELSFMITTSFNAEEFQYLGTVIEKTLGGFMEKLAEFYKPGKPSIVPSVDDIVVVKGSDDEYYRAVVLDVNGSVATALMFDSGYLETVVLSNIHSLDKKFAKYPVYGLVFIPTSKTGARSLELACSQETIVQGIFVSQKDKYFVRYDDEMIALLDYKSMFDFVKNNYKNLNKSVNDLAVSPFDALPLREFEVNQSFEVLALFQEPEDPKVFYVAGHVDTFENLMGLCNQYSERYNDNIRVNPLPRNVYLVKSKRDNEWYRAVINSASEDTINVQYIDFGNKEDNDPKYVMELSEELSVDKIKPLAVRCKVEVSSLNDEDLKTKIERGVEGAFLLNVKVIRIEEGVHYVELK